jgi:amidase
MAELAFRTATELVGMLRRREVSSRELLEVLLARVAKHGKALNAVVTPDAERARTDAAAADDELARGRARGPLHGLPMTIKDTFETAGLRTTAGAPELANLVPERDADAVARLRSAGAIVFGKTNVPFMAGDWQSQRDLRHHQQPVESARAGRLVGRLGAVVAAGPPGSSWAATSAARSACRRTGRACSGTSRPGGSCRSADTSRRRRACWRRPT